MKKILILSIIVLIPLMSIAQNWILLGNDPADDLIDTDFTDILSSSYYIDNDSIYFLLTSNPNYFPFEPGFGIAIGIDTNQIAEDGQTNWGGVNQSMKPDFQKIIVTNSAFPNFLPPEIKTISEDKDSLVLRFHLEDIDIDEQFNVIFGTGIYNLTVGGMVYDEAPNENYYTIDKISSTKERATNQLELHIYPNPASDFIFIEGSNKISEISIVDILGKTIKTKYSSVNLSLIHI